MNFKANIVIKKFSNYWYKSAFFTILQRFSLVFFGTASYIILVRILDQSAVGTWALFLAITTTFEMSKYALLKNGLVTIIHSTGDPKEKATIAASSLVINALFTLLFIILCVLAAHRLSAYWRVPALESMLYYYCITAIFFIPFSHFEYIQQANLSFKGVFAAYFTRQAVFFVLVIAAAMLFRKSLTLDMLVLFQLAGTILATAISFFYTRAYLNHTFSVSLKWIKVLIGYGKYVFGSGVCANIFGSLDRYMTASYLNSIDVAFYDMSSKITNVMDVPATAATDIIFPKSARASFEEGKEKVRYMYEKMSGILVGLVLPISIFVFIFAGWIVRFLGGEKYLPAADIIRIAMLYAVLRPVQNQAANILNAVNRPNITFYLSLVVLSFNLGANFLCIRWFGFMGAAYGTMASTILNFVLSFYYLHKAIGATPGGLIRYTAAFYRDSFEKLSRYSQQLTPGVKKGT